MPSPAHKRCARCGEEKPFDSFSPHGGGYAARCKRCRAADARARHARDATPDWYADRYARNKAERDADAASLAEFLQREAERSRAYRAANRDKVNAAARERSKQNAERNRDYARTRRARLLSAPVNDFTSDDWAEVLGEFNHACAYCLAQGVPLHREHMQPLTRGGAHTRSNIVPSCGSCNSRKGTRTLLEFFA